MRYGIRIIAALGLVALLVPVAAVAKDARVKGPTAIVGAGYFGGELELAMEDGQRPVKIAKRAGYIGVLDLAGDLKIRCANSRVQKHETEQGTVYYCATRQGGQVILLGSHFKFRGFAPHYRVLLPAGAAGSWHGRFVQCNPAAEASTCKGPKPERQAAEPKERGQTPERGEGRKAPGDDEEVPSLEELAEMLEGTE
jgi:hypothetical protein